MQSIDKVNNDNNTDDNITTKDKKSRDNDYDVIVIGAGVLGNAIAVSLANQGKNVALFERDLGEPDRIVGELLQPAGVEALKLLNMQGSLENIDGIPCYGYAILKNHDRCVFSEYPDSKQGISFHHGKFIMNLRDYSIKHPRVKVIEATVNSLITSDDVDDDEGEDELEKDDNNNNIVKGIKYTKKNNENNNKEQQQKVYAPLTIACDGCFSKFRKFGTDYKPSVSSHFIGYILKNVTLPYKSYGHVVLAKPSPVLLYQIGTNDTRILVDIPGKIPSQSNGDLKEYMKTIVMPQLPKSVQEAFLDAVETTRARSMPNSFLPPVTNNRVPGLMLLGDALNMRHPLTGGGMTVALWDVVHFTGLVKDMDSFDDYEEVKKVLVRLHWKRKSLSSVVNILAQALYELFSAKDDVYMMELQDACFNYLALGGRYVSDPVGFLSGLIPSPSLLTYHFFAVAVYGILGILGRSIIQFPINLVRSLVVFYTACRVILPIIYTELRP